MRTQMAQETLAIIENGYYEIEGIQQISIARSLEDCQKNSRLFLPEEDLYPPVQQFETEIHVVNLPTLDVAYSLYLSGFHPLALNFASAKTPGGGFLRGTIAQEESLAYASGLYLSLKDSPFYTLHRSLNESPLYSHRTIYSPKVPVFRDSFGLLLPSPWQTSFLTCAAPNRGALLDQGDTELLALVPRTMHERIDRVLSIAAHLHYDTLVLGAFGCGIFRNSPEEVAHIFKSALSTRFHGVFARCIFAIFDRPNSPAIRAFTQTFPPKSFLTLSGI